jgi:uncharacterized protein YbjT (DUF2867 family)
MTATGSASSDERARSERARSRRVAITGATGYMGNALTAMLAKRGHDVRALVRPGTRHRVAAGAEACELDLFNSEQLASGLQDRDTVVHLVGTSHPNPRKAQDFLRVDLASARACIAAAVRSGIGHFVYVSVAQPAPVMKAYVAARAEAERVLTESRLTATVLRPWYVLGPGHRWPMLLTPLYACAEILPPFRESAQRLGLVTLEQMTLALVHSIERPPHAGMTRLIEVPDIRRMSRFERSM